MKPGSKVICVDDHFYELVSIPTAKMYLAVGIRRNGVVVVEYSFRADRFVPQAKKEEPWGETFFHLKNPLAIPSIQN